MQRLKVGVVRFAEIAAEIREALGDGSTDITIGRGRTTISFRGIGAMRWTEQQRMDAALRAASIARKLIADSKRWSVRRRADRAIVVVYEDSKLDRGCVVAQRWESVVPAEAHR